MQKLDSRRHNVRKIKSPFVVASNPPQTGVSIAIEFPRTNDSKQKPFGGHRVPKGPHEFLRTRTLPSRSSQNDKASRRKTHKASPQNHRTISIYTARWLSPADSERHPFSVSRARGSQWVPHDDAEGLIRAEGNEVLLHETIAFT